MSRSTAIRSAKIFTPEGILEGDCLVEGGRIVRVGGVSGTADVEVDAAGRWLWPGVLDAHVHFRQPGPTYKEDWSTGSAAAVSGGVTTVFEMPNTKPTTTTVERLADKRALAGAGSYCNFGLFFGAGPDNHDEIRRATGVPGLKVFMGCSTGDLLVYRPEDLAEVFAAWDGRICVHAESELRLREREARFADVDEPSIHSRIRDPRAAQEAVELACELALTYERDLHVLHLSTTDELEALERARAERDRRGLNIRLTCEVCPHHLFLNTDAYAPMGARVRMNPPLRGEAHRVAMWTALKDGRVDMVATDHAPHTLAEKDRPYREAPSGVPGVETLLPIMLDAAHRGLCSPEDVLEWLCHRPAQIYGVVERGEIREGYYADLVLIDPAMSRRVRHEDQLTRCAWTPWAGREWTGWPTHTWVNGALAFRRADTGAAELTGHPGMGREVEFMGSL